MATVLLEKPELRVEPAPQWEESGVAMTPVLLVVRPSSSGMLRHVQGLIKYLPEHHFAPTLTGPDFIRDRVGLFADSRAVRILREQAKDFPIVHCHGVRAGWICAWALRRHQPWIWTVHHLLLHKSALVRAVWRWIARYPRFITAVSESVRAGLVRGGIPEERIEMVRGGIDITLFEQLPNRIAMRIQFHVPRDRPIVLAVGRFVPHKGFDIALKAMEFIWKALPDADLWLAGDGPDNARLVNLSLQSHQPHHIRFFGYWGKVEELYAAADVLVAPARDAGLGLAVMEAMAAGLPVVARRIPPLERLVKHEVNGLLVPPDDPVALAEAVLRLLQDRALAAELAANARATADRFDIRHTVAQTARLYRRLL